VTGEAEARHELGRNDARGRGDGFKAHAERGSRWLSMGLGGDSTTDDAMAASSDRSRHGHTRRRLPMTIDCWAALLSFSRFPKWFQNARL
jgi:hypothetical protein